MLWEQGTPGLTEDYLIERSLCFWYLPYSPLLPLLLLLMILILFKRFWETDRPSALQQRAIQPNQTNDPRQWSDVIAQSQSQSGTGNTAAAAAAVLSIGTWQILNSTLLFFLPMKLTQALVLFFFFCCVSPTRREGAEEENTNTTSCLGVRWLYECWVSCSHWWEEDWWRKIFVAELDCGLLLKLSLVLPDVFMRWPKDGL